MSPAHRDLVFVLVSALVYDLVWIRDDSGRETAARLFGLGVKGAGIVGTVFSVPRIMYPGSRSSPKFWTIVYPDTRSSLPEA